MSKQDFSDVGWALPTNAHRQSSTNPHFDLLASVPHRLANPLPANPRSEMTLMA
jgi:hypothetical protein